MKQDRTSPSAKRDNELRKIRHKRVPRWRRSLKKAYDRCIYASTEGYERYGGRGIKCNLTKVEAHKLWVRDKGDTMQNPQLDRKDPEGNYEYSNCRFLEAVENNARRRPYGSVTPEPIPEWVTE